MHSSEKNKNFLKLIEKYADEQKEEMIAEVEQYKNIEIKKAEDEGLEDAYNLIQKEIASDKLKITRELAKKEHNSLKNVFDRRTEIVNKVFDLAKEKLLEYTKTNEYKEKLIKDAKNTAEITKGNFCNVYIAEKDKDMKDKINEIFSNNSEVKVSDNIEIGGIRILCEALSIVVDVTLDSKLEDQIPWFTENSTLKVV